MDSFRDYDFIHTDGSVLENKAAAAVIDNYSSIERLPDKSSIFSAKLHALYLALDRMEMEDEDERNFIVFSDSESALQAIWGRDWTHPLVIRDFPLTINRISLLLSRYWNAFIGKYSTKKNEYYFIGFPVMLASGVMRRQMLLPKLVS